MKKSFIFCIIYSSLVKNCAIRTYNMRYASHFEIGDCINEYRDN